MDIFIHRGGRRVGPFDDAEVRAGIEFGEYQPTDLAWTPGRATWHPLKEILGLPEIHATESDSPVEVSTTDSAGQELEGDTEVPLAHNRANNATTAQKVIDEGMPAVVFTILDGAALWFFWPNDETIDLAAALVIFAIRLAVLLFAVYRQSRIAAILCLIPPIFSIWISFQTPFSTIGSPIWVSLLKQVIFSLPWLFLALVVRMIFAVFRYHRGRD
ncbi:DUF4339 domain-containing protein [Verrucomicrobiota bacterium sgz303538]